MSHEKDMKTQVKRITAVLLLGVLSAPLPFALSSEVYRWEDKDGNIFFSDTPPPPGVDAQIKRYTEEPTERPKVKEDVSRPQGSRVKEKRQNVNVIMYMTPSCPYCRKAREYIRSLNVNLIEYNVEGDRNRREEMLSKSGGATGVPLIDVEGILIRGYNPEAIRTAIEKRRYP